MTHPNTADPSNAHPPASSESLGVSLGPALREQCGGRLGPIEWFRNGWQHSGAATGFSVWNDGSGSSLDVMVKIPVGPTELEWTSRLAGFALGSASPPEAGSAAPASTDGHEPPTPLVLAAGSSVGNYDLAWLVMERLSGQTLAHEQDPSAVQDLIVAAADFHECAGEQCPIGQTPPPHEWERLIEKARHTARDGAIGDSQRWNEAIKRTQRHLTSLIARWNRRDVRTWCHGDLHPGNALRRPGARSASAARRNGAVLIDLALVHPGHWVEDALYLERLHWAKPERLRGVKPVSALAQLRRERGLPTNDGYAELAMIRRALMAACAPAFLEHEGHPKYLRAALENLEKALPQVAK